MTAMAIERLSASERLRLLETLREEMARDNSYQETPVGREVRRFIDWMRWKSVGDHTIANREGPLRLLALETRDGCYLTMTDLDGRQGARLLEAFLMREWGGLSDNTRANRTGVLRAFFKWAYREALVDKDPMEFVDAPKRRGRRRDAHPKEEILRLLRAQTRRDRLAIALMARQGLRKSELAGVQLGHINVAEASLAIFGKGSLYAHVPLFRDLAAELAEYAHDRELAHPKGWRREYLLYPVKAFRRGSYPLYMWDETEYRDRPLGGTAMQEWWLKCLERAGIPRFPMHELRHTAGTAFHHGPAKGDYELTRQFLRHKDVATTAGYVHSAPTQVTEAMRAADPYEETSS
jgi:integrase/recombinase XerC